MRRPINSVNGFYKDPSKPYSAQDALNVLPMMAERGGTRTLSKLVDAPGLRPFVRIGINDGENFTAAGAGRGMRVVDNKLFVVAGRNLWQITAAGVSINHGVIPGVGRVSMAHNQRGQGNELAIDNGQSRYVFNTQTQTLEKVTDESFPGSIKAFFIDGYLGYIEPQGRYWGHSDLSDALNYIAFDAYEAEGQPDRIVTGNVNNREVQIVGQETTEVYVNAPTGAGSAPFQRASNTIYPYGSSARDSCANLGGSTILMDQNRVVRLLSFDDARISTSVIETALQECTRQQIANAYAFTLEAEGFQIYYLTVPGKFTFGYDFKNREWHRRASTGLDWWAVTDVVMWNGEWVALDSRTGELFKLKWRGYPFDGQQELVREWVTGSISADQNPVFVHELELLFGCGGEAYEPVDFPDQPAGPSITGAAPDALIGEPYTYTYTVTAGDSPITGTSLRSGSSTLSAFGLSWDPSTATVSGTPTASGTVTLIPRVIDAAGLFDQLTDDILIGVYWYATDGSSGEYMYATGGGGNWDHPYESTAPIELPNYRYVVAFEDEILLVETATGGAFRPSPEDDWEEVTLPNLETLNRSIHDGTNYVLAGNNGRILWSSDGAAFTAVTVAVSGDDGTRNFFGLATNGEKLVAVQSHYSVSLDNGQTWSAMDNESLIIGNAVQMRDVACDGTTFVAGGDDNRIAIWEGEGDWTEIDSPFEGTAMITAVAWTEGQDGPIWVIGNEDGQIAYGADIEALEVSSFDLGSSVLCAHGRDGRVVIGGTSGALAGTTNGEDWTVVDNPSASSIFCITSVNL